MLAGLDHEALSAAQLIDLAEVLILEPFAHGAMTDIDTLIAKLHDGILEAVPDRETWGTSEQAVAGQRAAERLFGQAPPRT